MVWLMLGVVSFLRTIQENKYGMFRVVQWRDRNIHGCIERKSASRALLCMSCIGLRPASVNRALHLCLGSDEKSTLALYRITDGRIALSFCS